MAIVARARVNMGRLAGARLRLFVAAIGAALVLTATTADAQTVPTAQPATIGRPRIGLVLSGGGARGR